MAPVCAGSLVSCLCVCAPFCFCCPIWSLVVFVPLLCFSSFLVLCCGCPCSAVLGRDLAVATASAGHGSVCFRLCVLSFPCVVLRPFSVLSVALYTIVVRVLGLVDKKKEAHGGSRRRAMDRRSLGRRKKETESDQNVRSTVKKEALTEQSFACVVRK